MNVIILSLIVAIFWAINPIIVKYILQYTSFPLVLFLGNITTFIAVLIFTYINKDVIINDWKNISRKHISLIVGNTILFGFMASILYLYLLKHYDVNVVIGLTYMSPLFVVLLSKYFLQENTSYLTYLGILFIVLGGILISTSIKK